MMEVELLYAMPSEEAATLLLRTKGTRLAHDDDPAKWSEEKRAEHLAYMRDTIRSSWEFVDYVFQIRGVSRAFTHQLVRTRAGSYAQESQRTVDVRDRDVVAARWPLEGVEEGIWERGVDEAFAAYGALIDRGVPVQEARGLLPTATATSIVAKFNLRTLSDMARVRLCVRTQGEYQEVFRLMRDRVIETHPWAEEFIQVECCASGTCAFPRFGKKECVFWDPRMDKEEVVRSVRAKFWGTAAPQQVAIPIAKEGRTM